MDHIPYLFNEDIYVVKEKKTHTPHPSPEEKVKQEQPVDASKEIGLPYEGKNLKKILVLTSSETAGFLTESEKIFLGKILDALQFTFDDIAIVNVANFTEDTADKINRFNCRHMISFGVTNEKIPVNTKTPFYEVIKHGDVTFLLADPLSSIEGDQDKKRKLWNALKPLFSV